MVNIGKRLKKIRLAKNLTQGDILKATGLMRCYTSRVEHGITIPSLETLERYAEAFGMPLHDFLYQLTYQPPKNNAVAEEANTAEQTQESATEGNAEFIQPSNTEQPHLPC